MTNDPTLSRTEGAPCDRLLDKRQLAIRLSVSERSVDNLIARRAIRYFKIGRIVRFSMPVVLADLAHFQIDPISVK
jgi:hypothetical protein